MALRRRAATSLSAVLTVLASAGLSACGDKAVESVNYAVDGSLHTYNTNTVAGAA